MAAAKDGFIGVFDSGVGGISVLRALVSELPHEDFRFFGDSANAPYGEKTPAQVLGLSRGIVERMVQDGAKAIVIACNTATSVAANELRRAYPDLPIIGIEPALKPACKAYPGGRILVMATQITLALDKYQELAQTYGGGCEVISVPCPGLAARIEQGHLGAPDLDALLASFLAPYAGSADAVVLGCTHYPFVRNQIAQALRCAPTFFDGAAGTARQLRARLAEKNLLSMQERAGEVQFASSKDTPEELDLYRTFFSLELE